LPTFREKSLEGDFGANTIVLSQVRVFSALTPPNRCIHCPEWAGAGPVVSVLLD